MNVGIALPSKPDHFLLKLQISTHTSVEVTFPFPFARLLLLLHSSKEVHAFVHLTSLSLAQVVPSFIQVGIVVLNGHHGATWGTWRRLSGSAAVGVGGT